MIKKYLQFIKEGYKEIEFTCHNSSYPDSSDLENLKNFYYHLKTIRGVYPYMQDFSENDNKQVSLAVIIMDKFRTNELTNRVIQLGKKYKVKYDLTNDRSEPDTDSIIKGSFYNNLINTKVQDNPNIKKYFSKYEVKNFDDNCMEINNIDINATKFKDIKSLFIDYLVLYNRELKQMWIKDKPAPINIKEHFNGKYLYHDSRPERRESILKNGLKTNSTNTIFGHDTPMSYEDLLFFYDIDTFESYDPREDKDIWMIDVDELKAQWYDNPNKNFDEGEGVYCLQQDVPPNYLKLHK